MRIYIIPTTYQLRVDFFRLRISKQYEYLLRILKIENPDLKYDVVLTSKEERKDLKLIVIEKCNPKHIERF